mgnify:CR=1 FL=1
MAQDYTSIPLLKELNDFLLTLRDDWEIQWFAATNYHYPTADEKYAAEVSLAIKDGKKMYENES